MELATQSAGPGRCGSQISGIKRRLPNSSAFDTIMPIRADSTPPRISLAESESASYNRLTIFFAIDQVMSIPQVSIVGRPNVGKSSIFNWLAGKRLAIVDDMAGVTRDRMKFLLEESGRYFEIVDTGGIGINDVDELDEEIEAQISNRDSGRRYCSCLSLTRATESRHWING